MERLFTLLSRHGRFYIALGLGMLAAAGALLAGFPGALLVGGDIFYLIFLGLCMVLIAGQKTADLKKRARTEDEGILVVVLIILATMGFFCDAVFTALSKKHGFDLPLVVLAVIGAPLGWLALHTIMAFHYADIHYFEEPDSKGDGRDLDFPGRGDPGPWDFLYYSFVVGMTCQVSDVAVKTTRMRKTTLFHGLVSFFFNTVFIAMAVNAGVTLAS